jgi:hypothetical protein
VHGTRSKHIIMQEKRLMPVTPTSDGARLTQLHMAFAFAVTPVTFGSLVIYVLASHHLISYWWLAFTLGWAIVPLGILLRSPRHARRTTYTARQ